eukprot:COSAG06_NODE_838_length_12005_cov_473.630354_7_plen_50_part_00
MEPAAAGSGIPDMKGYLNGTNLRGALTCKALVAKVRFWNNSILNIYDAL